MVISAGDPMPEGLFRTMTESGVEEVDARAFFAGRRVVLFAVPAVFTPGCTHKHLPGYVDNAEAIKAKGFDEIACMAVSDAWVMHAWSEATGATGKVTMLADGSAEYTEALGLALDLGQFGMGIRSKRFAMVIQDGVVESVEVDARAIELTAAASVCQL